MLQTCCSKNRNTGIQPFQASRLKGLFSLSGCRLSASIPFVNMQVWLLYMFPYSYWASVCTATSPTYSAFMNSVRQASDLPPAPFKFPVTRDTLAFGYILPAVGRIGDIHPLKHTPVGRTAKKNTRQASRVFFENIM